MSIVGDNRIREHAYNLAHSGGFLGWQAVERELQAEGFSRVHFLLDDGRIREDLNMICAEARMGTYRDA